jgi:hypothetical protein
MAEVPEGITLKVNRDLRGRGRRPWYRRGLLCCAAALPILALLNVFGQKPTTTTVSNQAASLSVNAPSALRGGLVFQARVEVIARQDIHALEVIFDRGWWEAMTVNSIQPEPEETSIDGDRVALAYGKLPIGHKLTVWLEFSVNPTTVGKRRENVAIADDSTPLAHLHRTLTIFP